jgi:hypothetical protein
MDMNNSMGLRVGNAHNRINNLRETWQIFLDHLKQNTDLDSVPSNINVEDEVISVDCFGKQVSAYPRTVSDGNGGFAIEYVFYTDEDEGSEEIWRFYLTSNGQLVDAVDQAGIICDFNNRHAAKNICLYVLSNALESSIFRPSAHQNS